MKDIFDDKFLAFFFGTLLVAFAMLMGLPNAGSLADVLIGGMFGSAIGQRKL